MTWTITVGDWVEEAELSAGSNNVAVYENIVAVAENGIYHSYLGALVDENATINGSTVAICDRNTVITGDPYFDGNTGIVYVYAWNPAGVGEWEEAQTLQALDKSASAQFGCAIAAYGDTIVIGASGDTSRQGAVYVFTRPHGADPFADFVEAVKLMPSDGAADDYFGSDVALYASTLAVGAPWNSEAGLRAGAVYVFTGSGPAWSEQKLLVLDPLVDDRLGMHRTLAVGGNTLIAGCPEKGSWAGTPFGRWAGVAYVFTSAGGVWSQAQKLVASDAEENAHFGGTVAVYNDTLFIGQPSGKPEA